MSDTVQNYKLIRNDWTINDTKCFFRKAYIALSVSIVYDHKKKIVRPSPKY